MDFERIRAIIEKILREMGVPKAAISTSKWEVEESEPNRHIVTFEVPDLGVRSVSFSTSPDSNPESIKADLTDKIQLVTKRGLYKGYEIQASPLHLKSGGWSLETYIFAYRGADIHHRHFTALDTYSTEVEAIRHCLTFGQQIIDGKVEGCTVDDL
ncbi:hypothetical protein MYX82_11790 [Acidobacteria bacterium AH-259-D05]|nr:hypothetical protein [Acidobacteria bacterium AH-259-D05]